MGKRPNPFGDDFVQQKKVHVGLKQYNNNEERLQKVYEKTLQILFKGSKKTDQTTMNNDVTSNIIKKDGLKQLFIGANGSLSHSGEMVSFGQAPQSLCKCGGIKVELCAYCEKALCESCEHPCNVCLKSFCTQCSFFVSEGSSVCVSCYG